jgi:TolA-binding protein
VPSAEFIKLQDIVKEHERRLAQMEQKYQDSKHFIESLQSKVNEMDINLKNTE